MSTKPKQFYWEIEDLWAQHYGKANKCNFEFIPSEEPVFFDENNTPYYGLDNDRQWAASENKQLFLTDNHNKVLDFFFGEFIKHRKKLIIIHIDAHRDDAPFQHYEIFDSYIEHLKNFIPRVLEADKDADPLSIFSLREYRLMNFFVNQIQQRCRVSDYLDIAQHLGFIEKIVCITNTSEFIDFLNTPDIEKTEHNVILNLDIDIYGEEGSAVATDIKTQAIAKAWKNAGAVCIATSPGFIEADIAETIVKLL